MEKRVLEIEALKVPDSLPVWAKFVEYSMFGVILDIDWFGQEFREYCDKLFGTNETLTVKQVLLSAGIEVS